jgi:hypothetical protein
MLVDISKGEEEVLSVIREGKKYKGGNFETLYIELSAETRSLVEAAKIYILDNYKKVKDYKTLHLTLRCANHEGRQYFGTKSKRKKGGSKIFNDLINELNKQTVEIKKFDNAVYDWTDGDFSVVFNGVSYNWIDSNSIIDIAAHIERKLADGNKIL